MVVDNFIPNIVMCGGKKICETARKVAHNAAASTGKEEEKAAPECWWAKALGIHSLDAEQDILAGRQELLQEGSLWIRNFSVLKNSGDWQPLYFVLCTETLYYINKQASPNTFSGAIAIKDISSIIPEDAPSDNGDGGHCVRVRTKSENFVLHWRSVERRDKWLTSLLYAKSLSFLQQEQKTPKQDKDGGEYRVGDLVKLCLPIIAIPCKTLHPYDELSLS